MKIFLSFFSKNKIWSVFLIFSFIFYSAKEKSFAFDAFSKIEAESYSSMSGLQTETCYDIAGGINVGSTDTNDYMVFNDVNFGSGNVKSLNFRIASAATFTGFADIRIGSISGTIIGTVAFGHTGGWQSWITRKVSITPVSGSQNLYIVFRGGVSIGNINWFQFGTDEITTPEIPSSLTALAGNTQATLSWAISPSAVTYNLKRSTTAGGPYTTVQNNISHNSYTDTGLINGTTYYYVVSSVNSKGESSNSAEVMVKPQVQLIISCIGDSITYGAGASDPATKSYPAQLDVLLGDRYNVLNFGYSGATMLKNGDTPYWNQSNYNSAVASNPNIVVIKLGSNDSKAWNWGPYSTQYPTDYKTMIDVFRNLPSKPRIFIAVSARAFSDAFGISENNLIYGVRPYILDIANEKGVSVIDVYDATKDAGSNFPDGIHPNDVGAAIIASKVKSILLASQPVVSRNGFTLSAPLAFAYQWFKDGTKIQDAVSQNYVASAPGKYTVLVKINSANEDRIISTEIEIENSTSFPPSNPTGLAAVAENSQISLSWQAVTNVASYNIKRGNSAAGPFNTIQAGVLGTGFVNSGLSNGVTYYYVITASNQNGESSNSNTAVATAYNGNANINTANTYVVVSKASEKVLDLVNASTANGARVQTNDWSNVNNKKWKFEATTDGYYRIYNSLSTKSMDVVDASLVNNAQIQQWDWFASINQKWKVEDAGNGYVRIYAVSSGKLLDAGSSGAAQLIFQNDGSGMDNQLWRLDVNTLSVKDVNQLKKNISIYPSPATSEIVVENKSADNLSEIKIFDASGKLVYFKSNIKVAKFTIPVQQWANGIYNIITGNDKVSQKVIVNH